MGGKIIPDKFGIMAVDPGKVTGVGTGVFRTDRGDDMIATVFKRALNKRQISTWEERGPSELQAWVLVKHWTEFKFKCNVEYQIPDRDIHLVIEAFFLRELQAQLESVEVISGMKTLLVGEKGLWPMGQPVFQQPSTAKQCTNERLKRLGLWVTASTHRRDVMRHIVQFADGIL
jgi:hypothetical protein